MSLKEKKKYTTNNEPHSLEMRLKKSSISREKISVWTIDLLTTVLQSTVWQACGKELPCFILRLVSGLRCPITSSV